MSNKTTSFVLGLLLSAFFTLTPISSARAGENSALSPGRLRCEHLVDPLGIETSKPRLSWILQANGDSSDRGQCQTAYRVLVASSRKLLDKDKGDLWDSGKVDSDETLEIEYAGGTLSSRATCHWKARIWDRNEKPSEWSKPAEWSMGFREKADWRAEWIAAPGSEEEPAAAKSVPIFRREFTVAANIRRARAYVTALGCYEMWINGRRVGDEMLSPQWTDYNKRVLYQTFDVTKLMKKGPNAVGAIVAGGWYRMRGMFQPMAASGKNYGDGKKRLLAQIEIEYADGTVQTFATDGSWKYSLDGPWRTADIYDGIVYDARKEACGWNQPGFQDATWKPVEVNPPAWPLALSAQNNEPIRVLAELKPIGMSEPKPGVYVFDLGQNITGYCRVRLDGPAGATIRLRHAQVVGTDGMLYMDNLGKTDATDTFILKGTCPQTFEPSLIYHGFRYVELTGLPAKPSLDCLTGLAIGSDVRVIGTLETSDPLLDKLWQNIVWTYRGNMPGVVTDCSARNERYGWMGDGESSWQSICFAMDVSAFAVKWVRDMHDEQEPNGLFSITAPKHDLKQMSAPAWSDAGVIIPWTSYVNFADRRLLERSYEPARRYVEAILRDNSDYLWKNNRGNDYSDWLDAVMVSTPQAWTDARTPANPRTSKELFATAFWANSTQLVAKTAAALGKDEDADRYRNLAKNICDAFAAAYIDELGRIQENTQAGYAIPLEMGLFDDVREKQALEHLLTAVQAHGGKLSTGVHGTKRLLLALSANGRLDLAYALAMNPQFPSYRYMLDGGATTIWERFDAKRTDLGFNPDIMNDFSHVGLSGAGEWIWRMIVGLNPDDDRPGYKHFVVRPRLGSSISRLTAAYDSPRGEIKVAWKTENDKFTLDVTVPPNTTATVFVPSAQPENVSEGGKPAAESVGVEQLPPQQNTAVFRVSSGYYRFESADAAK